MSLRARANLPPKRGRRAFSHSHDLQVRSVVALQSASHQLARRAEQLAARQSDTAMAIERRLSESGVAPPPPPAPEDMARRRKLIAPPARVRRPLPAGRP